MQNPEAFHSHPLDSPKSNVGTYGDVGHGPGGHISPRILGPRRHYKRRTASFPAAIPRAGCSG